jgi:Protein of unknown function (DUF2637)
MERHPDSASSPGLRADPPQAPTAPGRSWLHRLANVVVAIVVLAVAAGMFVFSYPGVHAIARQGGVSGQLARFYPGLFDALLVIACVAAVMLRDARWWARCWAWLVALVVLAAIGVTDVLHAMSYGLRPRPTEGVVAAAPVVAVLLAFSLFLTMLRQSRPQPQNADPQAPAREPADDRQAGQPTAPMMFSAVDTVPVLAAGAVPRPPAPPIALPAVPVEAPADVPDDMTGDAADRGTAVTREQPALFIGASAPAGPTHPSTAESEAVEPRSPSAAVPPEPASATPETTAETVEASETADTPAETSAESAERAAASAETQEMPTATAGTAADTAAAPASTADAAADTAAAPASTADAAADTAAVAAQTGAAPASAEAGSAETAAEAPEQASDDATDSGSDQPDSATAQSPAADPAPAAPVIRYASSAATEQFANEDWEAEVDPALAGQVYPVLTSDPDIEVPPHQPGQSQDLEDDAPPFATAPFATVPRLNRVRVTPTPPTDDADQE